MKKKDVMRELVIFVNTNYKLNDKHFILVSYYFTKGHTTFFLSNFTSDCVSYCPNKTIPNLCKLLSE